MTSDALLVRGPVFTSDPDPDRRWAEALAVRDGVIVAVGSVIGGQVGAHVGRRLNPTVLRAVIVVVGLVAAIKLLAT